MKTGRTGMVGQVTGGNPSTTGIYYDEKKQRIKNSQEKGGQK